MNFTFLGSGSAFVNKRENYHSNVLFESENSNLLIDAGRTIPEALEDQEFTEDDIQNIFITHNHNDHTGGLEHIGFKRYFSTYPFGQNLPHMYGQYSVLEDLWEHNLSAGMKSMQGQVNNMETYFKTHYLKDNGSFKIGKANVDIIQTIHIVDDRKIVPSHGLMITERGKSVFFTGDSQMNPNQMNTFYSKADVIFHDCEIAKYPNSVHAQYHELRELPDEIKDKMYLYHFITPEDGLPDAIADGFAGFVNRGDRFSF